MNKENTQDGFYRTTTLWERHAVQYRKLNVYLSSMVATGHMWPLSIGNVAGSN